MKSKVIKLNINIFKALKHTEIPDDFSNQKFNHKYPIIQNEPELVILPRFFRQLENWYEENYKKQVDFQISIGNHTGTLIYDTDYPRFYICEQHPFVDIGSAWEKAVKKAKALCVITTFQPKIYIDSSIINHLVKTKRPEWQKTTQAVWREIIDENYAVCVSQTFFEEIDECYEPKKTEMYKRMREINYTIHGNTQEIKTLAERYLSKTSLPEEKCLEDSLHIANAVVNKCNILLSLNFSHMVNENFIPKFNQASKEMGYNEIEILSPDNFLKGTTT